MQNPPILNTERLRLRRLELSDAPRVQALAGDYEVAAGTLTMPHPYPDGAAEEFIAVIAQEMDEGGSYVFAIVPKGETALVGVIGLHLVPEYWRAEMGYWIGKAYWNNGYASEAARRVIQFGFEEVGLNRIHAAHYADNPASGRVMQKAGMTYEGTLRQHFIRFDQFKDTVYYGILRNEWLNSVKNGEMS